MNPTIEQQGEPVEFKILRSASKAFRSRATLERALAEEAQAGWVLVEKLDDGRLRLSRPVASRSKDAGLAIDAYRIHFGMRGDIRSLLLILVGLAAAAFLGWWYFRQIDSALGL